MHNPDFVILPFNREQHGPFVFDSFHRSTRGDNQWPWSLIPTRTLVDALKHDLASPGSRAVVAVDPEDPDLMMGWALGLPGNVLVFAFVKRLLRRLGVGAALVGAAGVDLSRPVTVRYFTRATQRIAAKGRDLRFAIPEDDFHGAQVGEAPDAR